MAVMKYHLADEDDMRLSYSLSYEIVEHVDDEPRAFILPPLLVRPLAVDVVHRWLTPALSGI